MRLALCFREQTTRGCVSVDSQGAIACYFQKLESDNNQL